MYSVELKIKRKNLADEARDIRKEERRAKASHGGSSSQYRSLYHHRTGKVRDAARTAHLAHSFLLGKRYRTVERFAYTEPNVAELKRVIAKFGKFNLEEADLDRKLKREIVDWLLEPAAQKQAA